MRSNLINWILLIILSAIWGGAFPLNKEALREFAPEIIVAGRLILGSAILFLIILIIKRKIKFDFSHVYYFLFMSIVGIVFPFILIAYGQKNIDSSLAGILMSIMPISTLILSHFFLNDEQITRRKFIGFLLALIGIIILLLPNTNNLTEQDSQILFSEILVIFGAIFYSAAAVYGKKYKITDPLSASAGTILFSAIIMFIYLTLFFEIEHSYTKILLSQPILLLGVFCTAFATILYFYILQTVGATFLSIMNYLIPVWSIIFGIIFFNEQVLWNYYIGLLIIIFGIQISQKDIYLRYGRKI
mgnify:CR=1 FL=1